VLLRAQGHDATMAGEGAWGRPAAVSRPDAFPPHAPRRAALGRRLGAGRRPAPLGRKTLGLHILVIACVRSVW